MNNTKANIIFVSFWLIMISPSVLGKLNPFNHAMALTTKYMPEAVVKMWETEHLSWRAQLLHASCTGDFQPINQEMNASYSLVHDYILDQAILNGEIHNPDLKPALQDAAKLHYRIYSAAYRFGFSHRVRVIKKYYPNMASELCDEAIDMSLEFPADTSPMLPWQHRGSLKGVEWRDNILAMQIINKYFFRVFAERHRKFGNIVDAQIYTMIANDESSYELFSEITQSYFFSNILLRNISQAHKNTKNRDLPTPYWLSSYIKKAERWATQAYMQSTVSVLKRIEKKYPERYQEIKNHMKDYIDLQRSELDAVKNHLQQLHDDA